MVFAAWGGVEELQGGGSRGAILADVEATPLVWPVYTGQQALTWQQRDELTDTERLVGLADGCSHAPESSRGWGESTFEVSSARGASVLRREEGKPQASNFVPSTTRFLVTRSPFAV